MGQSSDFLSFLVAMFLGGLVIAAIVAVLRGFLEPRAERPKKPAIPFVDFPPPAAVTPSTGVSLVGWSAMLWGAINLLAAVLWFATRFGMTDVQIAYHLIAVYTIFGSLIGGVGGMLLLGCNSQGRRMISWGGFLFTTITLMGFGLSLMIWASPQSTMGEKSTAAAMAIIIGLHLAVDAVIASVAQHVGTAPEAE